MFYKNLIDKSNIKLREYSAEPFESGWIVGKQNEKLPFGSCLEMFNFDVNSGALEDGVGIGNILVRYGIVKKDIQTLNLPANTYVRDCFYFRSYNYNYKSYYSLLILKDNLGLFRYVRVDTQALTWKQIDNLEYYDDIEMMSTVLNGKDALVFGNGIKMFSWLPTDSSASTVNGTPNFTSLCYYDSRAFATSYNHKKSILYSEAFDPLNFSVSNDQSGYINMYDSLGACNKVLVFKEAVYAIRDYGITKITRGKDKKDFEVENMYVCNKKIYEKTVCDCGEKLYFLTSDGVYSFDGNNAKKVNLPYEKLINKYSQDYAVGGYLNGNYYLACAFDFQDDILCESENNGVLENNAYIKLNINTEESVITRGVGIKRFVPVTDSYNNFMLAVYVVKSGVFQLGVIDQNGKIKDNGIQKFWKSRQHDFGYPNRNKLIKEMRFVSKTDITLKLYLDNKTKTINIKGKSTMQTIKINEKAKLFGFSFETTNSGTYISSPKFLVGIL